MVEGGRGGREGVVVLVAMVARRVKLKFERLEGEEMISHFWELKTTWRR